MSLRCPTCRAEFSDAEIAVGKVKIDLVGEAAGGVRAFASLDVGALRIDGVVILDGLDGRPRVCFARKFSGTGKRYPRVEATDPALMAKIEAAVLAAYARALMAEPRP
jgi:hypothetical protein